MAMVGGPGEESSGAYLAAGTAVGDSAVSGSLVGVRQRERQHGALCAAGPAPGVAASHTSAASEPQGRYLSSQGRHSLSF